MRADNLSVQCPDDDCADIVRDRDTTGRYFPVSTNDMVYIFDADVLHIFKVRLTEAEDDLPLITAESTIQSILQEYRLFAC